jgi:hypothetical protein
VQERQDRPQPGEEQADVVAGAHQDGVDGVASCTGEAIAFKQAVAFRVSDDRLDGAAPAKFAFNPSYSPGA